MILYPVCIIIMMLQSVLGQGSCISSFIPGGQNTLDTALAEALHQQLPNRESAYNRLPFNNLIDSTTIQYRAFVSAPPPVGTGSQAPRMIAHVQLISHNTYNIERHVTIYSLNGSTRVCIARNVALVPNPETGAFTEVSFTTDPHLTYYTKLLD
jgi:hypothetical protein